MMAHKRLAKKKRSLKEMGRRGLSLFLAMVMTVSLIQIGAFAESAADIQAQKQIVHDGGTYYYDQDGNRVPSLGNTGVSVKKTVNPTGIENCFQIQLEVVTTQDIQEISVSPDAAVVLVLDTSNSMVNDGSWETIDGVTKQRLSWAKDAANTFLENYVQEAGQSKRMVSIVEFGSNAKTVLGWTEANSQTTGSDGKTQVAQAVTSGVSAVENKFSYTYYDCNIQGEHTHNESQSFVKRSTDADWSRSTKFEPYTCSVCGRESWLANQHKHCTYPGCTTPQDTNHTHDVTQTYDGPHGEHSGTDGGGTNIEGGLMLARNLILAGQQENGAIADIENLYVILLTDGVPSFHVEDADSSTTEITFVKGTVGGSDKANYNDAKDVPELAANIKADPNANQTANNVAYGAKLYSLVYGSESKTIPITSGNNPQRKNINAWLTDTVKVTKNYPSSTGGDVNTNLGNIGAIIGAVAKAWIVTDPIPANGIVTFANSNLAANVGSFSASNSDYVNYWDSTNNQVIWDLKQDIPTQSGNKFTYTLTYDVILNTEHDAFVPEQDYPTNGEAKLKYLVLDANETLDDMTAAEVEARIHEAPFDTPTVKGYRGAFDFTKVAAHKDADGNLIYLGGAPFQLTNLANTSLDQPADSIQKHTTSEIKAEGKTEGKVAFSAIPSGYSYTLSEGPGTEFTSPSDGRRYEIGSQTWSVSVEYGVVTLSPAMANKLVENTLKQIPTTLTITKTWQVPNANSTQEITVYLKQDGVTVATLTLNGSSIRITDTDLDIGKSYYSVNSTATKWVYNLTVPSINQATGGTYVYTLEEKSLGEGYDTTYSTDKLSITNTTTGKTSVSVRKDWLPIDNKDVSGTMPAVTVTLSRTSENVTTAETAGTITLPKDNNWSYTWEQLEQYDSLGKPYTYQVSEGSGNYQQVGSVSGTGTENDPFVLTNTVLEGSISKTVTKTWKDDNANDRPPITVELLRDGASFSLVEGQTQTTYELTSADAAASNSNVWSYTFTGLPQYKFTRDNDNKITGVHEYQYTVKELTGVDGYTSIKDGDLGLVNTRAQKVSIDVTKVWDDKFTSHDEVTIALLQGGTKIDEKTTTNGAVSFTNLDQFNTNGHAYAYTVQEIGTPDRYTVSYNYGTTDNDKVVFGADHTGSVTVTNTLNTNDETVEVQVTKNWQHPAGTTAPEVTFTLAQLDKDGNIVNASYADYTMKAGTTTYTFENLPKYYYVQEEVEVESGEDAEGKPIITIETQVAEYEYQYSVSESAIPGYNNGAAVDGVRDNANPNQWTFTNTITGTITNLSVEKKWESLSSATLPTATIHLVRTDGTVNQDGSLVYETVDTWTTNQNGSHNWGSVAKYNAQGQLYTYKVVENSVPNYTTSYSPADGVYTDSVSKVTVTNTLTQDATHSYTVTKIWLDNSNDQNTRLPITLHLKQSVNGGTETDLGTVVISAAGEKLSTGTYTGSVSVTKDTNNQWTVVFSGLNKYAYANGSVSEYAYSVTEDPVEGYTPSITGNTVTNTLKQDTTSKTVTKNWVDPGTDHPNVTFTLTAKVDQQAVTSVTDKNGTTVTFPMTVTLGSGTGATAPQDDAGNDLTQGSDTWYYTWNDLPKYTDDQKLISYSVSENKVDGYTSEQNGNVFTNTIEQELLDFDGVKIWDMSAKNEDDVIRPDPQNAVIALYYLNADGSLGQMVTQEGLTNPVTVAPVTTTENGVPVIKGSFSFQNLPKYNLSTGAEYQYTVREVTVTTGAGGAQGYTPVAAGGTLTFGLTDQGQYTVTYNETSKTPTQGQNAGTDTTVTNTYSDPERYFYKITADYVTYFSSSNAVIYTASNVNVTKNSSGETVAYLEGSKGQTIEAVVSQYTSYNGVDFTFDDTDETNVVSDTLDQENKLYEIHLNYVRHLYKLSVSYVFPDGDKPASGYDDYVTPILTQNADGSYTDPGQYLGDAAYTGTYKAAPNGFEITQVTVKDSEAAARKVDNDYDGGTFANHDVEVIYVYARKVALNPSVTDPSFTIHKVDNNGQLITSDAASFQVYSDAACTVPVDGKVFSTSGGTVTINASDLGLAEGKTRSTWYLKEAEAPKGYNKAGTVWKAVVSYSETQVLEGDQWVNKHTWTLSVTENGQEDSALTEGILSVPNSLKTARYKVEYWFEQTPTAGDYAHGTPVGSTSVDDFNGILGYFDTKTAAQHYLASIPSGYVHDKDENATVTYSSTDKTIKIFYKLNVPTDASGSTKVWLGTEGTTYAAVYQTLAGSAESSTPYTDPIPVGGSNGNTISFSNLPKYENGKSATYRIYEVLSDGSGGWTKVSGNSIITLNDIDYLVTYESGKIVNTELTDITITKSWADIDNGGITYPTSAQVRLVNGSSVVTTDALGHPIGDNGIITITKDGSGKYTATVANLPAYDTEGNAITYTVEEVKGSTGYGDNQIIKLDDVNYVVNINGFDITNTVQRGTLTVTKTFAGPDDLGNDFTITVKNGSTVVATLKKSDAAASSDGRYVWTVNNLPTAAAYTVSESNYSVDGWTLDTANSNTADQNASFTNGGTTASASFHNAYTRDYGYLTITKTVSGLKMNEEKTFQFTVSGNNYGTNYNEELSITVTGNGTQSLTAAIRVPTGTYQVLEDSTSAALAGYEVSTTYSNTNGIGSVTVTTANTADAPASITVTNAYTYGAPSSNIDTIRGTKSWADDNNRDGLRPLSIRVQLFEGSSPIEGKYVDVPSSGDGSFSISYDKYLHPGVITVKEVGYTDSEGYHEGTPTGYTSADGAKDNSYTVTNTHTSETITIQAEKVWSSGSQQAVTFHLYADGQPIENATLTLDGVVDENGGPEAEAWKGTFSGTFYKYADGGKLISYTVEEESLGNRWSFTVTESDLATTAGYLFTVTNSYESSHGHTYYKVTVNYYDKETNSKIAQSYVSDPIRSGLRYDVTAYDAIGIEGYTYDSTTGDPLTGVMNGNKVINVWYVAEEVIPDVPVPGDENPEQPPIDTPDTPIPDVPAPGADVPATGDNLMLWVMAAAVSGIGLVWLAFTGKKRKEEET